MDNKSYLQQCKRVVRKTAGSADITVTEKLDSVDLEFATNVNMDNGTSYRGAELKFTICIKEPLRQVAIFSKPRWSVPMLKFNVAREFITRANLTLRIGNLQLDNVCGDVSFKTSAEFSSINDISSILCSFLRVHTSNGLDCFRALEAIKDRHIGAQDALNFVSREGAVSELVDEKLAPLLSTLFVPA